MQILVRTFVATLLLPPLVFFLFIGMRSPENPEPARTGGFGERTCHECHFDSPLNTPEGGLTLTGLPDKYVSGQSYEITITLKHPELITAGFQISARFNEGSAAGKQAGSFLYDDSLLQIVKAKDIQYLTHTRTGTAVKEPGKTSWSFTWKAPGTASAPIIFHLIANAANDDNSEFGDFIYSMNKISHLAEKR